MRLGESDALRAGNPPSQPIVTSATSDAAHPSLHGAAAVTTATDPAVGAKAPPSLPPRGSALRSVFLPLTALLLACWLLFGVGGARGSSSSGGGGWAGTAAIDALTSFSSFGTDTSSVSVPLSSSSGSGSGGTAADSVKEAAVAASSGSGAAKGAKGRTVEERPRQRSALFTDPRHPCHQHKLRRSLDATYTPYAEMKTNPSTNTEISGGGDEAAELRRLDALKAAQYSRWRLPLCMMPALLQPRPPAAELWLERVKKAVYIDYDREKAIKDKGGLGHFGGGEEQPGETHVGTTAHAIRRTHPRGADMPSYLLEYPYSMSFFRPPLYPTAAEVRVAIAVDGTKQQRGGGDTAAEEDNAKAFYKEWANPRWGGNYYPPTASPSSANNANNDGAAGAPSFEPDAAFRQRRAAAAEGRLRLFDGSLAPRDFFVHYDADEWDNYCDRASTEYPEHATSSSSSSSSASNGGSGGGDGEGGIPHTEPPLVNNIVIPDKVVFLLASGSSAWEVDSVTATIVPPLFRMDVTRRGVGRKGLVIEDERRWSAASAASTPLTAAAATASSTASSSERRRTADGSVAGPSVAPDGGILFTPSLFEFDGEGSFEGDDGEGSGASTKRSADTIQRHNQRRFDTSSSSSSTAFASPYDPRQQNAPVVFTFQLYFDYVNERLPSTMGDLAATVACLREHLLMWYNASVVDSVFFGSSADFIRAADVPPMLRRQFHPFAGAAAASTMVDVEERLHLYPNSSSSDGASNSANPSAKAPIKGTEGGVLLNSLLPHRHLLPPGGGERLLPPHSEPKGSSSASTTTAKTLPPPHRSLTSQQAPHASLYINEAHASVERIKLALDTYEALRLGRLTYVPDGRAEATYRGIVRERRLAAAAERLRRRGGSSEASQTSSTSSDAQALAEGAATTGSNNTNNNAFAVPQPTSPLSTAPIDARGASFLIRPLPPAQRPRGQGPPHPRLRRRTRLSVFIDADGFIDEDKEDAFVEREARRAASAASRAGRAARLQDNEEPPADVASAFADRAPAFAFHLAEGVTAFESPYYHLHSNESEPSLGGSHQQKEKGGQGGGKGSSSSPFASLYPYKYTSSASASATSTHPPSPRLLLLPPAVPPPHPFSRFSLPPGEADALPAQQTLLPEMRVLTTHSDEFGYRRLAAAYALRWAGQTERSTGDFAVWRLGQYGAEAASTDDAAKEAAVAAPEGSPAAADRSGGDDGSTTTATAMSPAFAAAHEACLRLSNCISITSATTTATNTVSDGAGGSPTPAAKKAGAKAAFPPPQRRRVFLRHYSPDRFKRQLDPSDRRGPTAVEHILVGYKHFGRGVMTLERAAFGRGAWVANATALRKVLTVSNGNRQGEEAAGNGGPPPPPVADGRGGKHYSSSSSSALTTPAPTNPLYGTPLAVARFLARPNLWAFIGFLKTDRVLLVEAMRRIVVRRPYAPVRYMWGGTDKVAYMNESAEAVAAAQRAEDAAALKPDPPLEAHYRKHAYAPPSSSSSSSASPVPFVFNRSRYDHDCCMGTTPEETYGGAIFVPIGRGFDTLDCYRIYEACAAGAIPIIVGTPAELTATFGRFAAGGPFANAATDWEWMRFGFKGGDAAAPEGGDGGNSAAAAFLNGLPPFVYADSWDGAARVVKALLAMEPGGGAVSGAAFEAFYASFSRPQSSSSLSSSSTSSPQAAYVYPTGRFSVLYQYHLRVSEWFMRHYWHTQERLVCGREFD